VSVQKDDSVGLKLTFCSFSLFSAEMNAEGPKENLPFPITASYFLDNLAQPSDYLVEVDEVDFDAAQAELVPSVPMAELERYKRIRERFEAEAAKEEAKKKGVDVEEAAEAVEIDFSGDVE
jgi:peroxin-6